VKKMLPPPRGSISRARLAPGEEAGPAGPFPRPCGRRGRWSPRIGKLTLAPTLKMQTSSGACLSASLRKAATSSSFRASSVRATIDPPDALDLP